MVGDKIQDVTSVQSLVQTLNEVKSTCLSISNLQYINFICILIDITVLRYDCSRFIHQIL